MLQSIPAFSFTTLIKELETNSKDPGTPTFIEKQQVVWIYFKFRI